MSLSCLKKNNTMALAQYNKRYQQAERVYALMVKVQSLQLAAIWIVLGALQLAGDLQCRSEASFHVAELFAIKPSIGGRGVPNRSVILLCPDDLPMCHPPPWPQWASFDN
jgi:hypothetical protein